jgi:hypothetical protein
VESVVISQVDENREPVPGSEREFTCDTLLISAGLIPENELTREAGIEISARTKGAVVSDDLQTSRPGVFSCGNVLHVHDLVDFVSAEGEAAGRNAALYVKGALLTAGADGRVPVTDGPGVNGVVPQYIRRTGEEEVVELMFRPRNIYKNCTVCVDVDGGTVLRLKKLILAPGEMSKISVNRRLVSDCKDAVTIRVEG